MLYGTLNIWVNDESKSLVNTHLEIQFYSLTPKAKLLPFQMFEDKSLSYKDYRKSWKHAVNPKGRTLRFNFFCACKSERARLNSLKMLVTKRKVLVIRFRELIAVNRKKGNLIRVSS